MTTDSSDISDSLTLRVAKAIPSDVGHGRARVPFDNDLNLKPGDIIQISGEQDTAAIVWRCRPEDANLGVIRIDGIIRKKCWSKFRRSCSYFQGRNTTLY